jgi:hypothetical protein
VAKALGCLIVVAIAYMVVAALVAVVKAAYEALVLHGAGEVILLVIVLLAALFIMLMAIGSRGESSPRLSRQKLARELAGPAARVEAARSDSERRLVLVQEFMNLAGRALAICQPDNYGQVRRRDLAQLLSVTRLLLQSARESEARGLPDASPPAQRRPSHAELVQACNALVTMLDRQIALATAEPNADPDKLANQMRMLQRARTDVELAIDAISRELTA